MSTADVEAVVVGAGIAGLAASLALQGAGREVVLIDASDRPGGVMRTDHISGYVVERGPNTAQIKAPMRSFLEERGLAGRLVKARPASKLRFVYRDGALQPIPTSPLAFLRTPLLSTGGKLRLLLEPLVRRGDASGESVAEFVGRRLGREVVPALVGPFLTGVYAGDENQLGAGAVFSSLAEHERRYGSLAAGMIFEARRGLRGRGLRGSHSAEQGFGPFARELADRLADPPALSSRVQLLARDGERWRVDVSGPSGEHSLSARRVVIATPSLEAGLLLRGVDAELASALESIVYAPIASVALGVDPAEARERIDGFGFLVPREAGLSLLGCLFMSRLFPGRAPETRVLLQCILGGTRWPEVAHTPDDAIRTRVDADLERILGLRPGSELLTVSRWERAIPQPDRDHINRIRSIRERLPEGLELAGAYLDGVSVADTFASGLRAAASLSG